MAPTFEIHQSTLTHAHPTHPNPQLSHHTASSTTNNNTHTDRPTLLHALALLARALPAFRQSQDRRRVREAYYLEARLHDRLAALQAAERAARRGGGGGRGEEDEEEIDHVALREEAARHFFEVGRLMAAGVGCASPVAVVSAGPAAQ